jgi:mannose-1-phosphate guanylyltransferase
MCNVFLGILAGGAGERLWPLSRKDRPKQLIPFLNGKTLLQETVARLYEIVQKKENIFIVTCKEQEHLINKGEDQKIGFILREPVARNTGPAILLGCHEIHKKDPESIVGFFPSDHFIPEPKTFAKVIERAIEYVAGHNDIATIGIMPTSSATGYGYIQANFNKNTKTKNCFYVSKFHEKPNISLAHQYLAQENMFWNAGMFLAKASVFLDTFKECSPKLYAMMQQYREEKISYDELENISVDYAIMEKNNNMVVFPACFEWNDVGTLDTFLQLQKKYSQKQAKIISIDANNNLVSSSKKIVAFVGVNNICVIETNEVLLIVQRDKTEEVKKVVTKISEQNF